MMEKVKDFYQKKRDWVWLAIAILIVIISGAANSFPPTMFQETVSNSSLGSQDFNKGLLMSNVAGESFGRSAPTPDENFIEPGLVPNEKEKIRKNASLNLDVNKSNYSQTKSSINNLIAKHNGFYTNQNESVTTYNNADYYTYSINIKFANDNFDQIIEEFKVMGEVKYFNVDASDLTTQYYDLASYKESAEQVKARVQALLARATAIEDIINIETKLADLQRQIDSYQQQLINIDRQTEYSQLSLTVTEKMGYVQSFYEMTKLRELFRNVVLSIDNVFVKFSRLFGYLLIIFIAWLIYKGVKRIKSKTQGTMEK